MSVTWVVPGHIYRPHGLVDESATIRELWPLSPANFNRIFSPILVTGQAAQSHQWSSVAASVTGKAGSCLPSGTTGLPSALCPVPAPFSSLSYLHLCHSGYGVEQGHYSSCPLSPSFCPTVPLASKLVSLQIFGSIAFIPIPVQEPLRDSDSSQSQEFSNKDVLVYHQESSG